jgi:hypothetical protein
VTRVNPGCTRSSPTAIVTGLPARSGHDDARSRVAVHRGRAAGRGVTRPGRSAGGHPGRPEGTVLAFVTAPADELMTVLSEQPEGPTGIQGDAAGAGRVLAVEARRNEVWLTVGGVDAAVGLDALMDAMAALPS